MHKKEQSVILTASVEKDINKMITVKIPNFNALHNSRSYYLPTGLDFTLQQEALSRVASHATALNSGTAFNSAQQADIAEVRGAIFAPRLREIADNFSSNRAPNILRFVAELRERATLIETHEVFQSLNDKNLSSWRRQVIQDKAQEGIKGQVLGYPNGSQSETTFVIETLKSADLSRLQTVFEQLSNPGEAKIYFTCHSLAKPGADNFRKKPKVSDEQYQWVIEVSTATGDITKICRSTTSAKDLTPRQEALCAGKLFGHHLYQLAAQC